MSLSRLVKELLRIRSRDRFGEKVRRGLIARGLVSSAAVYDPEMFAIQEGTRSLFLDNLFAVLYHRWPWQRGAEVRRWIASIAGMESEPPIAYEEAKQRLLPGLRHPVTFAAMRWVKGAEPMAENPAPGFSLGRNLQVCLFLDSAESMRYVDQKLLEKWDVTFEAAFAQALENLRQRSSAPLRQLGLGVAVGLWADTYDGARLLLPEVLAQIEAPGDPVAFVPGRSSLILTGDRDEAALGAAMKVALEAWENEPRPVSVVPIVRRGGQWEELVLPRGHACHPALKELRVREAAQLYEEQTAAMQAWFARRGEDVFVGNLLATKHQETDEFNSIAVWSKGVDSLLPRAEQWACFDPEGDRTVAVIDFDLVESRLGNDLEHTDHVPERFRVRTFPSDEAIAELRQLQERRTAAQERGPNG